MSRFLRSYAALIRMGLAEAVEYRAQILIGLLLALVPLIMMAVWLTLVDQTGPSAGWQRGDFIAYYVGAAMVFQFTASYTSWEWEEDIRTGDLSSRLLKPLDPFHFYLSRRLGRLFFDVLLITPVVVLATFLVPRPSSIVHRLLSSLVHSLTAGPGVVAQGEPPEYAGKHEE